LSNLVSIIISHINGLKQLGATLGSLQKQSYPHLQVLVVCENPDTATTAALNALSQSDKRFSLLALQSESTKGKNTSRNFGLQAAEGDYIKWMDSGTLLHEQAIELQLQSIIQKCGDLCISGSRTYHPQDDLTALATQKLKTFVDSGLSVESFLLKGSDWPLSAGLWRKDWFGSFLPFDEELRYHQEWLMHLQSLAQKLYIVKCAEVLCYINEGDKTERKQTLRIYHLGLSRIKALKTLSIYKMRRDKQKKTGKLLKTRLKRDFYQSLLVALFRFRFIDFILLLKFYPKVVFRY
jgi:glycosyltransferase involved in cell wall biosynthesis